MTVLLPTAARRPMSCGVKRRKLRKGAATVEFAINAMVFFMLVLVSLEFARFMMVRQSMDQAAYEGARVGIIPGNTAENVKTKTRDFLSKLGIRNPTITVSPSNIDQTTVAVTVEVTAKFSDSAWISPMFSRNKIIRSRVTLDHENLAVLTRVP